MSDSLSHIERLESESIHIRREAVAQARSPVILFSGSKYSTLMAHLALRAFYPGSPPLPLLHIDASERRGRVSDRDSGSLEEQERQGYF